MRVLISGTTGIQAFLPEPFGIEDSPRVVGGFDGKRKKGPRRTQRHTGEDL